MSAVILEVSITVIGVLHHRLGQAKVIASSAQGGFYDLLFNSPVLYPDYKATKSVKASNFGLRVGIDRCTRHFCAKSVRLNGRNTSGREDNGTSFRVGAIP